MELCRDEKIVRVKVRKEIVLSCGAVMSPVLLMNSGVGPKEHLADVGVPLVLHSPGVGSSLTDHLHVPLSYRVAGGVKLHSHTNVCEGSLFVKLRDDAPSPDLQVHIGSIFFNPNGFIPEGEGFTLTPTLIHPKSRGTIRLQSSDPLDKPRIRANYLTDVEGYDLKQLVDGLKLVRQLGDKMVLQLNGVEEYPGPMITTDDQIENYIREHVGTTYHPTSTCKMGAANDPLAVVDTQLKVRGVTGLRVADASVMPVIVGANTNATCVAIGEKVADMVVTEHKAKVLAD